MWKLYEQTKGISIRTAGRCGKKREKVVDRVANRYNKKIDKTLVTSGILLK